ncbi:N-6 DNA methylase [Enterococcus faecalis]|uniref:restriction endonuclease subunit M n=1 Tax=Enterococcus faecalis TaxID=1351 RepID=UPI001E5E748E|nr:N-6 DNA methylase [Enterococcus faecalis]MCD4927603.1 N-6 DNA methylase [Enterococcus faecalis]MCD5175808.1 N-6 DNA methylase [Enterococcus faecalis]MDQ4451736.1 N-6 DNA methylase [Enterococcus faecalis]WCG24226.1 N-6 DNA methylase [Enterococcus faecalis]
MELDILEKYLNNAKKKVVESFDIKKKEVKYSEKLKGWSIAKYTSEEQTRSFLLTKLVNELGYDLDKIEIETEYPVGRKKNKERPRIDVIVRDDKGNAFMFIEIKEPQRYEKEKDEAIENQLFNLAPSEDAKTHVKYLVYYSYEITDNEIKDKSIIIDFEKFKSYDTWKEIRDYSDELPQKYGIAQKEPYVKGGEKDLEKDFTHQQIDGIRTNLHNVLWGGGGTDDNEVFSSLVNIILAKIQDESEKNDGEKYDFQILTDAKNNSLESNKELYERINDLYKRALSQRMNVSNVKDSKVIDINKFSLSKLKYTVSTLESYSFVDGKNSFTGKDILGDFFEGIIREGFKQSKGQFFTHINIVKFLLWGLQLDKLAISRVNKDLEIPFMIDPSSGSGTFLIEYMKFITDNLKYRFKDQLNSNRDVKDKCWQWFEPDNRENKWAADYIYGSDINFNLGTATKVNMILHGDGSTNVFVGSPNGDGLLPFQNYKAEKGNTELNKHYTDKLYCDKQVNGRFDVIITNPPFSVDLDNDTKRNLKEGFLFPNKKNSENLFIERYYQLLRENGRLGVVLPESVFDTTENKYIRLFIYKYFKVKAIVSLPQVTFEPFTSTKTSLLFAQKKTKGEIEEWNKLWNKYSIEWEKLATRVEKEIELQEIQNLLTTFDVLEERSNLYKKIKSSYSLKKNEKDNLEGMSKGEIIELLLSSNLNSKWAISSEDDSQRKQNIIRILKGYDVDNNLSLSEIVQKYFDELTDLVKYDKDTSDVFGFVNTWWVFGEVAKEISYSIFMAEVDNVGYKRTRRGEKLLSNDLYDLEIAPDELEINEVLKPIEIRLLEINSFLDDLDNNTTKKAQAEIAKLSIEKNKLEIEKTEVKKIVLDLYEHGKLKNEYIERLQQDVLTKSFSNKYLLNFKSNRMVLRSNTKVKTLDFLRGVIWE